MENSNEEIRCDGEKDGIRLRRKRLEVKDGRTEEVMIVDDTVGTPHRQCYINKQDAESLSPYSDNVLLFSYSANNICLEN